MSQKRFQAAVFLDRDGTLNRDTSYIKNPEEFILFPDSLAAVKQCNGAGLRVLVVTNQSGLARGYFSQKDLDMIHQSLREQLEAGGAWIDDILVCPHHPDDGCWCRKPNPGLIDQATNRYPIDLKKSYMVGDKYIDLELAVKAKIKGVLVKTGPLSQEAHSRIMENNLPVSYVAESLQDAVNWILKDVYC